MKNHTQLHTKKQQNNKKIQSGRIAHSPQNTTVSRSFWQLVADVMVSTENTELGQSYLPLGNQYALRGINYKIDEFNISEMVAVFDQYRIDRIDIYASKNDNSRNVTLYTSFDPDDSAGVTWEQMSRRRNARTTSLKINEPRKLVATFKPVVNFKNTGPTGPDSPQNVVPMPGTWIDSSSTNQSFNGVKFFATAENNFSITLHAQAFITFKGAI